MRRIGIPKTVRYFSFEEFFKDFFTYLGFEIIVSPDSTKKTLQSGARYAETDMCLPIKMYFGHVASLVDKGVDYVFLPSFRCVDEFGVIRHEFGCEIF